MGRLILCFIAGSGLLATASFGANPTVSLSDIETQATTEASEAGKVASGSIVIPDEIAHAVVPYFDCVNKAINDEVGKAGKGATAEQMPLIEAAALQTCRATRDAAATKADKLLLAHDKKMAPAARTTKIESTLVGIEAMFTGMAEKMEKMNAAEKNTEKTNAPNQ